MNISQAGINLIKKYEGCSLTAYKDLSGVWTIGYGWTGKVGGKTIVSGMKIDQETAEKLLVDNLYQYEKKVEKYASKYHFNQNQFDALVSFAYNIGSIDQLTANGTRTIAQIKEHWAAYNKAGGKVVQGLVNRRKDELTLFNRPSLINDIAINKNGNIIYVDAVNINGNNFIKLRDIEKLTNLKVSYSNGQVYIK